MRALPDLVALASFSTELGDVNICLKAWRSHASTKKKREPKTENAPKWVVYFETIHPKAPLGRICSQHKAKVATGHQPRLSRCSWASRAPCNVITDLNSWTTRWTHSGTPQSRPAGQRRAPVTGWWNPRSVLTLRERAGCKTPSRGLIQSTTTPFRLFVSSERAPEIPFCIYNGSENVIYHK